MTPNVQSFFDDDTNTISYVVSDPATGACAIIDPVLNYDAAAARTATISADRVIDHVRREGLNCEWVLETHVHADHLSAAPYVQGKLGGKLAIGDHITITQSVFGEIFNAGPDLPRDGSQFDQLFHDGDSFPLGKMTAHALHTPGHTPACMTYVIGDAAFVGDTMFMPDYGTARADFPGGDARILYRSIRKIFTLPGETRLFMCHDYGPGGRAIAWETTVAEERAANIHVGGGKSREEFIAFRTQRDKQLAVPKLIIPALQVNMRAGHVPKDADGNAVLKVPVNGL